jgi:hypothetical protein
MLESVAVMTFPHRPQTCAEAIWDELSSWLNSWYYQPDLDGLRIVLCAAATHTYPQERPLWLLLIGDSGSGKTEIAIDNLMDLPDAHALGRITPACFLSSREKGGRSNSLLFRHGSSQLWLFKDFTTFLSMRADQRAECAAQLREIWDGHNHSDTGCGDSLEWSGKVTVIAAATPEFEEHWAAMRNLGDRFMTVRWHEPDDRSAMAELVRSHAGHEEEIHAEARRLVLDLWANRRQTARMPSAAQMRKLDVLANIVTVLQVHIPREGDSKRSIARIPNPAMPTRIALAISQVVRTHMDLFEHDEAGEQEFRLARRLAFESMPPARLRILSLVPDDGTKVSCGALFHGTRLPRNTLAREIENLVALRVLDDLPGSGWAEQSVWLNGRFRERIAAAGVTFQTNDPKLVSIPKRGRRPSSNPESCGG